MLACLSAANVASGTLTQVSTKADLYNPKNKQNKPLLSPKPYKQSSYLGGNASSTAATQGTTGLSA